MRAYLWTTLYVPSVGVRLLCEPLEYMSSGSLFLGYSKLVEVYRLCIQQSHFFCVSVVCFMCVQKAELSVRPENERFVQKTA